LLPKKGDCYLKKGIVTFSGFSDFFPVFYMRKLLKSQILFFVPYSECLKMLKPKKLGFRKPTFAQKLKTNFPIYTWQKKKKKKKTLKHVPPL
jgi:hypothetical protein